MANNKKVTQEELINLTYEKLVNSGISISKSVLEVAIRGYNETKIEQLSKGLSFEESGIGVVSPSWRKVSKAFNPKEPYTPKVVVAIDGSLKKYMQEQLRTSPEFREAVGAQEL